MWQNHEDAESADPSPYPILSALCVSAVKSFSAMESFHRRATRSRSRNSLRIMAVAPHTLYPSTL
jgi:hypothetical protein